MNTLRQNTFLPKASDSNKDRKCYVIDAEGKILGKIATKAATILRGKHKPTYTPHMDMGDMVIVINAEKVRVTGKKLTDKIYKYYTGYPSGQRTVPLGRMIKDKPTTVIELAVKRMIPSGALGTAAFKKLKVYAGAEHPHKAQTPIPLEV